MYSTKIWFDYTNKMLALSKKLALGMGPEIHEKISNIDEDVANIKDDIAKIEQEIAKMEEYIAEMEDEA